MGAGRMVGGSKAALLVAADEFGDPKLAGLRAPQRDVEALGRVLVDPSIGGYEVRTLLNEPHPVVLEEIEEFFADRSPDDLLLLYFSCHGIKDVAGRLYFAAATTKLNRLGSTGLSSAWINEQLDRTRSRRVVLLLDCCYSGAFAKGLAPRSAQSVHAAEDLGGRGRVVITASDAMEYAWEGDDLKLEAAQPAVFTRALVQGLETGEADSSGDGTVSVDELYDYVYDQVRRTTPNQTPTKSVFGNQGGLLIARNPNPPAAPVEPVPLPAELESALYDRRAWIRRAAAVELGGLLAGTEGGLVLSAQRALQLLVDDEDREVSAGAARILSEQEAAASPSPEPDASSSTVAAPGESDDGAQTVTGEPAIASEPATSDDLRTQMPVGTTGGDHPLTAMTGTDVTPDLPDQDTSSPPVIVPTAPDLPEIGDAPDPASDRPEPAPHRRPPTQEGPTDARPRGSRRSVAVGLITLGSAVLVAVGTVVTASAQGSLRSLWLGLDPWYVLGFLLVVITAGGLSVRGGARTVVGRCLVVASAALSTFGTAFLVGKLVLNAAGPPYRWHPLLGGWLELAGHLLLLVAAGLAIRSLVPDPDARPIIERLRKMLGRGGRVPLAGWMLLLVGGAGAGGWMIADPGPRLERGIVVGAMAFSPDGERLYAVVANQARELSDSDFRLVAVDTTSDNAIRTTTIGPTRSLDVSPDGLLLYAAGDPGLTVIDVGSLGAVGNPESVPGSGYRLVASSDGDRVYVASREDSSVSVFDTSATARLDFRVDLEGKVHGMAISLDGEQVYVATDAGVTVISAGTGEVGGHIEVFGTAVAVSPDGDTLFVAGHDNDPGSDTYQASYVAIVDPETGDVEAEIPVSDSFLDHIVVSPSGRRLYVAGLFTGFVAIDPVAQTTIGEPIPFNPYSMAIGPDGSRLYLGGSEGDIWVVDTATNEVIGDAIMVGD